MLNRVISVSGEGFLQFFKTFDFPIGDFEGMTIQVDGENQDDLGATSNGSGKSSVIESVAFLLFGELCRKNRYKDEVINKDSNVCSVSGHLEVDRTDYWIERTIERKKSPELRVYTDHKKNNELWLNSTYSTKQEELEKIIGMNFSSFQCYVMFGRDFMSFPDLKPAERAKMLTDVRGLEKYTLAAKKAKEWVDKTKNEREEISSELKSLEGRLKELLSMDYGPKIKSFEEERKENIKHLKERIAELQASKKDILAKAKVCREGLDQQLEGIETQLSNLTKDETAKKEKEAKAQKLQENIYRLRSDLNRMKEKISGYIEEIGDLKELGTGICPTCRQEISGEVLKKEITKLGDERKGVEAQFKKSNEELVKSIDEKDKLDKAIKTLNGTNQKVLELSKKKSVLEFEIKMCDKPKELDEIAFKIVTFQEDIEEERKANNPFSEMEEERKFKLEKVEGKVLEMRGQDNKYLLDQKIYQFALDGFKKIKFMLFDTMISSFERLTSNILSQYTSKVQVRYETERETKSGSIKDEFHIVITDDKNRELSYEMYSGGEKQKIRLSISMALAQLIKDQCGRDWNFIALDEPNDALDEVGKDNNFEFFEKLAKSGKAVLVTDHDALFKDKFDQSILVVRKNDKSELRI